MKSRISSLSVGLLLAASASGDVVVHNFNNSQTYPTCCGEFGAYGSFETNVTQDGTTGTIRVNGVATDNGGFYRDQGGAILWDFTAQTNLVLVAKALPGNEATNFLVVFRDVLENIVVFSFPFASLNTNSFTTLTKSLASPDWSGSTFFVLSSVTSVDVYGDFTESDLPFRLELDLIKVIGPAVVYGPPLNHSLSNVTLTLSWPTNAGDGYNYTLQSTVAVPGGWTNQPGAQASGTQYWFTAFVTNGNKFFRLIGTNSGSGSGFAPANAQLGVGLNLAGNENAQNGGVIFSPASDPIPPFTPVPLTNWIDVSSYVGGWTNALLNAFDTRPYDDAEGGARFVSWSDHNGGVQITNFSYFEEHIHDNPVFDITNWHRGFAGSHFTVRSNYWNPASGIWPNGLSRLTQVDSNALVYSETNQIGRPTIPYEKILGVTTNDYDDQTHRWFAGRWGETHLHLHTGRHPSNWWYKFVLVPVTASRVDSIDFSAQITQTTPISFSNITVLGEQLDANDSVFKQLTPNATHDVTPSVNGQSNYIFEVVLAEHKLVDLTRSYHPYFEIPPFTVPVPRLTNLQASFNAGSLVLGKDDDEKIRDSDPSVAASTNASSLYRSDDVPLYVEFRIMNGPLHTNSFTHRKSTVFPKQFEGKQYHNLRNDMDVDSLIDWTGANIKIVKTLYYNGSNQGGAARRGVNPARIILPNNYTSTACIHEWGHSCGLAHRGEVQSDGSVPNPGPATGQEVMASTNVTSQVKINRYERGLMQGY